MRGVLLVFLLLLSSVVWAQSLTNVSLPVVPSDVPAPSKEWSELVDQLAALPTRPHPEGPGHQKRLHLFENEIRTSEANHCDAALLVYVTFRHLLQLAASGGYPDEAPRLALHIAQDALWARDGWSACERSYGPLYGYQPLARTPEATSATALRAGYTMTPEQCEDLEDRIAELEASNEDWNGPGRWGRLSDAQTTYELLERHLLDLKHLRAFCPAAVARLKALQGTGHAAAKASAPRPWIPPPVAGTRP
jgi:hypothetical protein